MGFSNLEFLGQIALFERCLRGAAPTPFALPYPFRTWPGTRMGAERDKREVRKFFYLRWYFRANFGILMYGKVERVKHGETFQNWNLIFAQKRFQRQASPTSSCSIINAPRGAELERF